MASRSVLTVPALIALLAAACYYVIGSQSLPKQEAVPPVHITLSDEKASLERFRGLLKFRTVSDSDAPDHLKDPDQHVALLKYLESSYPKLFKKLDVTKVAKYSLLLKWQGSDPSLKPILCISHTDVVPAGNESSWTHPPFEAKVADGFVWGRGTIDVKVSVSAMLEAATELLNKGFNPVRTLYFAFGHDEEVGGALGAGGMARLLTQQGVQLEAVLDEGSVVMAEGVAGMTNTPVALVGTAEKGYLTYEVQVESKGGHASMPKIDASSAPAILSRLITAVESRPPPPRLQSPAPDFLSAIAPHTRPPLNFIFRLAHNKVIGPLLARALAANEQAAPMVRFSSAATYLHSWAGADNVIPPTGAVKFNFRTLLGDQPEDVEMYLRQALGRDVAKSRLRQVRYQAPTAVTPAGGPHFRLFERVILETLAERNPGLTVAPFLLYGMTDSASYRHLTNNTFRFLPLQARHSTNDLGRIHAVDERVGVEDYLNAIGFYVRLLEAFTGDASALENPQPQP